MSTRPNETEATVRSGLRRSEWFVASYLALVLTLLDVVVRHYPSPSDSVEHHLLSILVTAPSILVAYFALWYGIRRLSRRWIKVHVLVTPELVGLFCALAYLSMVFLKGGNLVILALSVASLPTLCFAVRFAATVRIPGIVQALLLSVPLVLAEKALLMPFGPTLNSPMVYAACAVVTLFAVWRVPTRLVMFRAIPVALLATVGVAAAVLAQERFFPGSPTTSTAKRIHDPRVKRVILLTVDTLRADALSCYNPDGARTPNIDSIAQDSAVFESAISPAPWTVPAVASLLTGHAPCEHGMLSLEGGGRLSDRAVTLAEVLRDAGYYTAALGYNFTLGPQFNFCQGFDEYDWYPRDYEPWTLPEKAIAKALDPVLRKTRLTHWNSTRLLTRRALSWLRKHHEKEFFLWLHYYDPHLPYTPPAELLPKQDPPERIGVSFSDVDAVRGGKMVLSARERQWLKTLYHGEVELVDDAIGTILKSLKRLGIYEDCLLAFTSDHGEEFFEHGGFEHGHTLYQEVLRVPLVVKPPRSWNIPPTHIQAPVSTQRTMPTILDFCGIKTNSEEMTCPSLLGYVRGANGQVSDLPVFSAGTLFYTERQAFITNGVKYIEDRISGRMELYDLKGDPEEKRSLAEALPEASAIAGKALADYREKMMAHRAKLGILAEKASLDQGALRELRSLGYVK